MEIIGQSSSILNTKALIQKVAPSNATVLIIGESGTGKELVAKHIHIASKRHQEAFVPINCAAIPSELLESELFGYEKGSFTGANSMRKGRFELANQGTMLLDEIGDMPLRMLVKLLRVLQEKTVERIGGAKSIGVDVRVIAATNKDLEEDYLALLNGERFDFSLAGQSYEDNDGGLFNTNGYTRFELLSFYKHHFHQLEELLAPKGYIDFQLSDPLSRFEKQDMQFPVSGLNQALDHALDTCQGWT